MKPNVVPSNLKSTKRNQVASYLDEDEAKIYAVEDTPMISHGSSLSSLSGIHTGEESGRLTIDSQDKCEQHVKYQVEDTPVCFSRNSSLSSLSIESLGIEPTPLEQALLDECISSGMPKVRIPESSNERKSGKHKGNLLYCASVSKDNRTTNNRISHQMDSIQETVNIETDVKNNVSELNNSLNSCHEAQITHTSFETENPDNDGVSSSSTLDDHSRKICDAEKEKFEEKNCFPPPLPNPENDVSCLNSQDACSEASNTENSATLEADKAINLSSPSDHNVNELSTALLVEMEAARVVVEVQNEANKLPEEMDQSMVSLSSDLIDNINPPSVMGEILSGSMISSGASESLSGIHPSVRRGSFDPKRLEHSIEHAQINKSHSALRPRVVPELVMRALADGTIITKPPSVIGSMENLSMRSSAAGDLIDNIKPPSLMEDTDMASSTYSVCSIVSEIADSKSEGLDIDGSLSSDIVFRCLKPVVAMAELYARDGNMIASNRSNVSASEKIENVNPPSTFLEIIDTINDCTEVGTDTLENNNDTDVEDELPPDPEPYVERDNTDFSERPKPDDTICSMQCEMDHIQSEDNFNDEQGDLDITPEEVRVLREDARLILSSLNEIQFQELAGEESLSEDMLIECETLSLVSNESDSSHSTSESPYLSSTPQRSPSLNGGPRIVKPGNRDAQKQDSMSKEESRNGPKPIRGRRKALYPRQQVITPFSNSRFSSPKIKDPKVKEMAVKPTRTSALRATQSQQKVSSGTRVAPDTCSPVIPVQRRTLSKSGSSLNSSGEVKTVVKGRSDNAKPDDETGSCEDEIRPKPPIKQGTFTKDKPSQNSPPKISPTKTRIPTYGGTSPVDGQKPPSQNKDDRPPRSASSQPNSGNSFKNGPSKSFGEGKVATTSPKTITRTVTGGQQNNKSGVAKGSNSPVLQSQRSGGVASPRKVSNIRSSPSTHSLGGSNNKRGNSLITKVNGLYGTLSNAKRSSSNVSLSSNTSSSTSNSRKSSGCSSNKKEAQSKISSIWKSNNRMIQNGSGNNSPPVGKPKEGLSRSSTYEKLPSVSTSPSLQRRDNTSESNPEMEKTPPEDCPLQSDRSNKTESGALSSSSKLVTKETMKALAEARIQKWTDRKARILAKKASNEKDSTSDEHENSGYRTKEAGSPVNETSNFISTDHETSDGNLQSVLPSSQPCNNSNLSDAKGPTSAIVPPYNYTPSSMQLTRTSTKHHSRSLIPTLNHVIVSPNMRQKDTYIHSTENDIGDAKHPCMVTTV